MDEEGLILRDAARDMRRSTAAMTEQLDRLTALVISLEARLRAMEKAADAVSVDSGQAKQLLSLIRARAAEICAVNSLADPKAAQALRAACRRQLLEGFGIRDIHDLPARDYERAVWGIKNWSSYALIKRWKYGEATG